MVMNDGRCSNEEVFWNVFKKIYGKKVEEDKPVFDDFYANEFQETAKVCGRNPKAGACVKACKAMDTGCSGDKSDFSGDCHRKPDPLGGIGAVGF